MRGLSNSCGLVFLCSYLLLHYSLPQEFILGIFSAPSPILPSNSFFSSYFSSSPELGIDPEKSFEGNMRKADFKSSVGEESSEAFLDREELNLLSGEKS